MNQRHRGVEKLTAILPRAKTKSRSGRSAAATENGGQRGSCIVWRGLAVHRKHKIANRVSATSQGRNEARHEAHGAKTRRSGESSSAWILAELFGENYATPSARIWDRGFTRVGAAI